jgi:hypothetical protein
MRRREFIGLIGGATVLPLAAHAQSKAIPRIAIIGSLGQNSVNALKEGLRGFGLVDEATIIVVGGPATTVTPEAVSAAVSNLISQKIDVIFASGASPEERLRMQQAKSQSSVSPAIW